MLSSSRPYGDPMNLYRYRGNGTYDCFKIITESGSAEIKCYFNERLVSTDIVGNSLEKNNFIDKRVKDKAKQGYRKSKLGAREFQDNRVMLCRKMKPDELEDWWEKYVVKKGYKYILGTPKLNGLCCELTQDRVLSRTQEHYHHLNAKDFHGGKELLHPIHGELYAHGYTLEDINSMVRGEANKGDLILYAFDLMTPESVGYLERLTRLPAYATDKLQIIKAIPVHSPKAARQFYDWCLDQQFEGAVWRFHDTPYQFGARSIGSFKCKPPIRKYFKIVSHHNDKLGRIIFTCASPGGSFNCVPAWSSETREDVGKYRDRHFKDEHLLVEYYEDTKLGKPRHPVGIEILHMEGLHV